MADTKKMRDDFCKEFILDFNAKQAAIRAGYAKPNARQQGCRLLTRVDVQDAINAELDKRDKRIVVKQDRVVYELAQLAFADLGNYIDVENGTLTIRDLEDIDTSVLSEATHSVTDKSSVIKIKMHDRLKALELLGRHLAMFTDKTDHSNKDGSLRPVVNINIPDNKTTK